MTRMRFDTPTPCASCPYRRDAPPEKWHPQHFSDLLRNDKDEVTGAVYGCHGTAKMESPSICAGWLLDQRRRGYPSIQLRLVLMQLDDQEMAKAEAIHARGLKLFASIEEMCQANLPRRVRRR